MSTESNEQYRAGFEAWLGLGDRIGPQATWDGEGYDDDTVNQMFEAWTAAKREASTEPSAGSAQETLANVLHTLQITTDWSRLNQAQIISRLREVAGALTDDAKDAPRYRWLRDVARSVDWSRKWTPISYTTHCRTGAEQMDKAIDAAIEAHTMAGSGK